MLWRNCRDGSDGQWLVRQNGNDLGACDAEENDLNGVVLVGTEWFEKVVGEMMVVHWLSAMG